MPDDDAATIERWFGRSLSAEWFDAVPEVIIDRDEVLVLATLAPDAAVDDQAAADQHDALDPEDRSLAAIVEFRERTRERRIDVAARAETRFGRKVSWGAVHGTQRVLFTHLGVPVMTRLRIDERAVLDTLVAAGVARSRSDALGWCVRLVAEHEADWIEELRAALVAVDEVRTRRSR